MSFQQPIYPTSVSSAMRSVGCCIFCLLLIVGCQRDTTENSAPVVSLHSELGGDATGFERACEPVAFNFPEDHNAHPSFRNEWWYFTGNVESKSGTRFGFHVTFFRIAVNAQPARDDADRQPISAQNSTWSASQFYMGHFAITEDETSAVVAHERFARAAAGLAGAQTEQGQLRVWLDNWTIVNQQTDPADFRTTTWQLSLAEDDDYLDLSLRALKPVVEQGIRGYSQKSRDPCNSSYYYSIPRLQVDGTISRDGKAHKVSGSAWLDREWSSSALADDQIGWDWFALQLDDGRDLMVYHLRRQDGSIDPYSYAVTIDPDGTKTVLPLPEYDITRWWTSPSGARYPVDGSLTFNNESNETDNENGTVKQSETIRFAPLIDNQEMNLTVRYWEGAIKLTDANGAAIGRGYLELTGY